jgi:hypothetical protein
MLHIGMLVCDSATIAQEEFAVMTTVTTRMKHITAYLLP